MTTWPLLPALVHPLNSHTGKAHCDPHTVPQWRLSLTLLAPLKAMFSTFLKLLPKESHCCPGDVWASLSYPRSGSPFLSPQPCSLRSEEGGFSFLSASSAIWVLGLSCKPSLQNLPLLLGIFSWPVCKPGGPYLGALYLSMPTCKRPFSPI